MTRSIEARWGEFGVEPICRVREAAPLTYYAAGRRPPSRRRFRDDVPKIAIARSWRGTRGVYGADTVWAQLRREGHPVARCTVADEAAEPTHDPVNRTFHAAAPNRLGVADPTDVNTHSSWVLGAFVVDVYSRPVVGWPASRSLRTDLTLGALEMAIPTHRGDDLRALIHRSDWGRPAPCASLHEGAGADRGGDLGGLAR